MKSSIHLLSSLYLLVCIFGCDSSTDSNPSPATGEVDSAMESPGSATQYWVATTGQVADALRRIAGDTNPQIKLFCGPGMDPHSFAASTGDVQAMADADAIFYNGFHLEAKLHELLHHEFAGKSWAMASAFPNDARLDWIEDGTIDPEAPFDPHIWNHLPGWATCVQGLIDQVCTTDPDNEETYRANGQAYVDEILAMHESAIERFGAIPEERRVLVSAHDAFNYFAENYGFEAVAVLGVGNDAEADVRKMREVAETVSQKKVPVIFIESITNPKVTQALQEACQSRDWQVEIADQPLYSDDLGSSAPQDTFLGAFNSNVDLIVQSLAP
ncbi:MAG: zinc ABC transporter substrate-binding protein [Planctomycetota bacterium]